MQEERNSFTNGFNSPASRSYLSSFPPPFSPFRSRGSGVDPTDGCDVTFPGRVLFPPFTPPLPRRKTEKVDTQGVGALSPRCGLAEVALGRDQVDSQVGPTERLQEKCCSYHMAKLVVDEPLSL